MVAAGLLLSLRGANMLPLVGMFVWISGARELAVVRARHALADPLAAFGLRPERAAPAPRFAGRVATGPDVSVARTQSTAGQLLDPSGARRPSTPWQAPPSAGRRLSAEELERLERHPGPLFGAEPD
jgi:hypothetical protein